jgi:hypothetical protein
VYLEVGVDELVMHAIDGMGQEFDSMVVPRVRGASASRGSVKPWVVGTKVVGTR